jgi:hypothetical protein
VTQFTSHTSLQYNQFSQNIPGLAACEIRKNKCLRRKAHEPQFEDHTMYQNMTWDPSICTMPILVKIFYLKITGYKNQSSLSNNYVKYLIE